MRVGIFTFGSRGDVQPLVALGLGLQRAGHEVFLSAPSDFAELASQYGVPFRPFSFSMRETVNRPKLRQALESGNVLKILAIRMKHGESLMDQMNWDAWNLSKDLDAIVARTGAPSAAYSIARKRGIPAVEVLFAPLEPSREIPAIGAGMRKRGGPLFNRLMGHLTYQVAWRVFGPSANRFRRRVLQMPAFPFFGPLREYRRTGQPVLHAFSPTVLPRPNDWRPDAHVVGYFYLPLPPDWKPPEELCRFLEAGPRPVLVGFGSMPSTNPEEKAQMLLEGLRRSGQRAVLQAGWGKLGTRLPLPNDVFLVDDLPHGWLMPRMAAVMHHGGAGTTASGLCAGVPSIIFPHMFDQFYWAQRLYELGVSPQPVPIKRLTAERVASAIQAAVTDTAMQRRAAEIGAKIRAEHGVERAVELFTEYVDRFRAGSQTQPRRNGSL